MTCRSSPGVEVNRGEEGLRDQGPAQELWSDVAPGGHIFGWTEGPGLTWQPGRPKDVLSWCATTTALGPSSPAWTFGPLPFPFTLRQSRPTPRV